MALHIIFNSSCRIKMFIFANGEQAVYSISLMSGQGRPTSIAA